MVKLNENIVTALNDLIEICRDGEKGYRAAADKEKNTELKTLFGQFSNQRAQFVSELQSEVSRLGGRPEDSGTATGALHRGWFNVKSAVTGDDDKAIISECERGEDAAVKTYRQALQKSLPDDIKKMVRHQYEVVKDAHDRVRALELEYEGKGQKRRGGSMLEEEGNPGTETEGAPD